MAKEKRTEETPVTVPANEPAFFGTIPGSLPG